MYQMLIFALVIPVGDDGVNPKSRPTFSFFAQHMCNKLQLLPTAINFRICRPYQLINILYKHVCTRFNALQRALQGVVARLNAVRPVTPE